MIICLEFTANRTTIKQQTAYNFLVSFKADGVISLGILSVFTMVTPKKDKRQRRKMENKKNKLTEAFDEAEKEEQRSVFGGDNESDEEKGEDTQDANAKGVALFDLDVYGRKVATDSVII